MIWVSAVRKLTRPVITILVFVATIYFIIAGIAVPPEWWVLVTAIGLWWFHDRSTKAVIEQLNNQRHS